MEKKLFIIKSYVRKSLVELSCLFYFQYYRFIEVAIKQCRQSGIDCKIHGLSVIGRFRSDEDSAAGFSFLASDREEEEEENKQSVIQAVRRKTVKGLGKDIQTHVFTWGLNDKDQLGGPKGSKVLFLLSQIFSIYLACLAEK